MAGYYSRPAQLARQMRQLLFPRRCPCCRRVLGTLPFCEVCIPRLEELRRGPVMRLDVSRHYLGALDGAAAPYRYEGVVRSAILRAKYEGESWTAVELGVEMTARLSAYMPFSAAFLATMSLAASKSSWLMMAS